MYDFVYLPHPLTQSPSPFFLHPLSPPLSPFSFLHIPSPFFLSVSPFPLLSKMGNGKMKKGKGKGKGDCRQAHPSHEEMRTRDEVDGNLLKVAIRLPREAEATK